MTSVGEIVIQIYTALAAVAGVLSLLPDPYTFDDNHIRTPIDHDKKRLLYFRNRFTHVVCMGFVCFLLLLIGVAAFKRDALDDEYAATALLLTSVLIATLTNVFNWAKYVPGVVVTLGATYVTSVRSDFTISSLGREVSGLMLVLGVSLTIFVIVALGFLMCWATRTIEHIVLWAQFPVVSSVSSGFAPYLLHVGWRSYVDDWTSSESFWIATTFATAAFVLIVVLQHIYRYWNLCWSRSYFMCCRESEAPVQRPPHGAYVHVTES